MMHLKRCYESTKTSKQNGHNVKMKQDRPKCGLHLQRLNKWIMPDPSPLSQHESKR